MYMNMYYVYKCIDLFGYHFVIMCHIPIFPPCVTMLAPADQVPMWLLHSTMTTSTCRLRRLSNPRPIWISTWDWDSL